MMVCLGYSPQKWHKTLPIMIVFLLVSVSMVVITSLHNISQIILIILIFSS